MAKDKNSFIAYSDWGDIFDELEDVEAGKLVKHLFDYVRDKNPIAEDKLTKMMFIQIQQALKRDLVKYDKYIDKQSVNGKKGGRPKKNPTLSKKTQPLINKPKKADSVSVSVSVSDSVNDINIHRAFDHLSITKDNYNKLLIEYEPKVVDRVLDNIENFGSNKKYKNLYLTAKNWLAKEPKRKTVELEEKKAKKTWSAFTDIND